MNLSPIVLFVYNRVNHTKRIIDSLKKNTLSGRSELYIYSDGPKNEFDEKKVNEIRKYIHQISGFKNIEIIEREKNLGLAQSVISGVSEILGQNEKVIVIEDDIFTVPSFLTFLNNALEFYKNNKDIFSISGYTYPVKIPESYNLDVLILKRISSWGWATWKDKWKKADWELMDFQIFKNDKIAQREFNRAGEDLTPMLFQQMGGKIDSWAIRWAYAHFKNNAYCLYPVKSLCKNIGVDSSGTHSATTKKYDVEIYDIGDKIKFTSDLKLDQEIMKNIKNFFEPSVFRKIINRLKTN